MEFLVLLGLGVAGAILVLPVVAIVMAAGAQKRSRQLEHELEVQGRQLLDLQQRLRALERAPGPSEAPAAAARAGAEPQPRADAPAAGATAPAAFEPSVDPAVDLAAEDTAPAAPASAPLPEAARTAEALPPDAAPQPDALDTVAPTAPLHARSEETAPGRAPAASPSEAPAPVRPPAPVAPPVPFEQQLAGWFTRIGAVALLLGVLYFFKYAADNEWIGPAGRVALGALFGLAILVVAEVVRPKTRPAWVHAALGVGISVLYIVVWSSHARYELVTSGVAFGANVVVLGLGAALAHRHRAEAVLVLVLLAGFANPVLLSTGVDRPLALFTYLLLLSSAALGLAVLHGFRFVVPVALLGVFVLAAGWYGKYFEVHDLRDAAWGDDVPPETRVGAYHPLAARVVPLLFLALFSAQWVGTAFVLRARATLPRLVVPLALAGSMLADAGVAALLYDRPVPLGIGMIAAGAGSLVALAALGALRWVLAPMLAAFALSAALLHDVPAADRVPVLVLLGVWAALHVTAFLRAPPPPEGPPLSRADALRAGLTLGAFAVLAAAILLPAGSTLTAALLFDLVAVAAAVIALRARFAGMVLGVLVVSLLALLAAAAAISAESLIWSPPFVGLAGAWAALFIVVALRLADRSEGQSEVLLATVSVALVAFVTLALAVVDERAPTLRALLTAAAGLVSLALATSLSASRPERPLWVTVLAAQAIGLFAAALGLGFEGTTLTASWAVLTAITALILGRARSGVWFAVVLSLASITLGRALLVDLPAAEALVDLFELSRGRRGVLALPVLFNLRAYALVGTGAGFLAAAFALGRASLRPGPAARPLSALAGSLAVIAYALLTALAITEARAALLELPPVPPVPLDYEEFAAFMDEVRRARDAHRALLAMTTTLVLALVGSALLAGGFAARDPFHRYLGLAVFVATIGKLVLGDVWTLPRIYQVVVFIVVGLLLLASGFLYARLKVLFTRPSSSTGLLLLALLSPGLAAAEEEEPAPARLLPIHAHATRVAIEGVAAAKDHVIRIPVELYGKSESDELFADLRVAGPSGQEVPYLIREVPAPRPARWIDARLYDPGRQSDDSFRAVFEVPETVGEHCEVALDLRGDGAFLRRTRVETGHRLDDFAVVAENGLVWSVSGGEEASDSRVLRYPRSKARYLRVSLLPSAEGGRVRIEGGRVSCATPEGRVPEDRLPLTVVRVHSDPEQRVTELELDVGHQGVPLRALELEIDTPEFVRPAEVAASAHRSVWPTICRGILARVGGAPSEPVRLWAPVPRKRHIRVTITDKDDAPLSVTGAVGILPVRELVFRAAEAGPHTLYVGHPEASTPRYDLAAILARRESTPDFALASLGAITPNPDHGRPVVEADLPLTERHRGLIGGVMAVLLLGLALWAVRLIKQAPAERE